VRQSGGLWRTLGAVVLRAAAVLTGVLLLSFGLTRVLPGDPAAVLGALPGTSEETLAALRQERGLDEPVLQQLVTYGRQVLEGDLGQSLVSGRPVAEDIAARAPASLELALVAMVLALSMAVGLVLLGLRFRWGDAMGRALAAAGSGLPVFVTGLLLIQLFYVQWGLAPEPSGRIAPWVVAPDRITGFLVVDAVLAGDGAALRSALAHLVLPAVTLAVFAFGPLFRVMRAGALQAMAGPGVAGAQALGLPDRVVLWRYALPEAVVPVLPVAAVLFGYLLGAGVLAEAVFAWPGLGRYALDSLMQLDHAPVQGVMLVLAAVHVAVGALAEAVQRMLDPRLGAAHG
jgi:peptide/nickel transport system permease protein